VYHGFVEFYLDGRWVKATPAFNRELCERHHGHAVGVQRLEDAMFSAYNLEEPEVHGVPGVTRNLR